MRVLTLDTVFILTHDGVGHDGLRKAPERSDVPAGRSPALHAGAVVFHLNCN